MVEPWKLFDNRIRSANIARRNLPFTMVASSEKQLLLKSIFQQQAQNLNRVIYIHTPFCNIQCPFCIYNKQVIADTSKIENYFDRVIRQIRALSSTKWVNASPFKAIYFGGGTPTSVPVEFQERILHELKQNYPLSADCEITVESTIADLNLEKIERLKNAGVNRISLGVQSFHQSVRRKMGRRASQEQILETISAIQKSGISNICIDLMYNLKDQDFSIWQNDLSAVGQTAISGCSVYPLILPPNSANPTEVETESFEKEYQFFIEADNSLLENKGWERHTSVQYGNRENGDAVYVKLQGHNTDLLAFGSGAGGRIGNFNYLQTSNLDDYISNNGDFMNDSITVMQIHEDFLKYREIYAISESLKINNTDYLHLKPHFDDIVLQLKLKGMLSFNDNLFELTQTGRFWAGNISAMFTQRIRELIERA